MLLYGVIVSGVSNQYIKSRSNKQTQNLNRLRESKMNNKKNNYGLLYRKSPIER